MFFSGFFAEKESASLFVPVDEPVKIMAKAMSNIFVFIFNVISY